MHKNIRNFDMNGVIRDDSDIPRIRLQYEAMIVTQMREDGYVPLLGFGPIFSTQYVEDKNHYTFIFTVFGVYVGKRKSCLIEGMDEMGRFPPRSIAKTKLKQP